MKCLEPFVTQTGAFGCGRCLPCRVQKRREWTARILLEALDHGENQCSFVTLTYAQERRSLNPPDLTLWLKRIRKRVSPKRLRYFAVGEYGSSTWRPHYHVALFGHGPCGGGRRVKGACQCLACLDVRETWKFGHVMVGRLTAESSAYIAGYVTKKMTHRSDIRLLGREPEFSRMSRNPGIGVPALWTVASDMMRYNLEGTLPDVPSVQRFGPKILPLGPFLRKKLREMVGKDAKAPESSKAIPALQLRILREYAWNTEKPLSEVFVELNQAHADALQARSMRRSKGETF